MKQYSAEWRARNREKSRQYTAAYRERNPTSGAEYMAHRRAEDREGMRAQERARYAKDPERFRAKTRSFLRSHKPLVAALARKRRARKAGAEGAHTPHEIKRLFARQRGRCAHCRTSIKNGYHADHIKPLVSGGSNWIKNIQLLCERCNTRKGATDPIVFAQREGLLL